jgi:hypothetical protein
LVNLAVLQLWFGRVVGRASRPGRRCEIFRLVLCNVVLAAVAGGAWWASSWLLARAGIAWPWGTRRLAHALLLFATIGAGFVSYSLGLKLLRFPGADELWELPKRILARLRGTR